MPELAADITPRRISDGGIWQALLAALLASTLMHAVVVLFWSIDKPILDEHSFRQAQTALSSYWIMKGGPWLAYETPVLGFPWAIPFEFPLYQLLVAALGRLGLPLDIAGRLIGFAFFLGSLWPLRTLYLSVNLSRASYLATAVLFVSSPLYLYWSRTFVVESCALFFALLWLAMVARYLAQPSLNAVVVALVAGSFAILAKSTTFPAFAVIGGFLILFRMFAGWRREQSTSELALMLAVSSFVTLMPFVPGFAWVYYSDYVKSANEFGRMLTSHELAAWNFGSQEQRLSSALWTDTVRLRVLPDSVGRFVFVAFGAIGAAFTSRPTFWAVTLALLGFLLPFLVFTNLHIIHNYYQNANAVFFLAAVGIGIGRIFDSSQRLVALAFLVILTTGEIIFFYDHFAPYFTQSYLNDRLLRISSIAKDHTKDTQSLLIIGQDWSSVIPYLAERKALALPAWTPRPLIEKVLFNPQSFLVDRPLGGIVYCADAIGGYKDNATLIQAFVTGRKTIGEFGGCALLAPNK